MKTGALAALCGWAAPNIIPARVLGLEGATPPNEKIGVGFIGCGQKAMGTGVTTANGHVVACCDPVKARREALSEKNGNCKTYNDFRDMLADPAVDAVYVVTPDHWHVPATLVALQAGKHVYVEKPLGLTIAQDLRCREAVQKSGLVVQYGTQQRSDPRFAKAVELVLNGYVGEIKEMYAFCAGGNMGGERKPGTVPEGFDYDLWLGPAPQVPFDEGVCLGNGWTGTYWIYDYSIGFLGGWGAHVLDIAQWWADLAGRGMPVTVEGTGEYHPDRLFNTVGQWDVTARFADGLPVRFLSTQMANKITVPGRPTDAKTADHGTVFVGTDGWIFVNRAVLESSKGDYQTLMQWQPPAGGIAVPTVTKGGHFENFYQAIRNKTQPISPIDTAVRSDLVSHLSDIAIRLKRPVRWDPVKETIVGDAEATEMMQRPMREPYSFETLLKGKKA